MRPSDYWRQGSHFGVRGSEVLQGELQLAAIGSGEDAYETQLTLCVALPSRPEARFNLVAVRRTFRASQGGILWPRRQSQVLAVRTRGEGQSR